MKRLLSASIAGALGLSLMGAGGAIATSATAAPKTAAITATSSSTVRWGACADERLTSYGIECSSIAVPLNYANPGGRKIHIAISRKKRTASPSQALGSMLVNPGGPGGSGLIMPVLQDYVPNGVGGRFDWIGFDPRGVGESRPRLQCNPSYFGTNRPAYVPRTAALMSYWRAKTKSYARACGNSSGNVLLRHLTTRDNARDMNEIRKALGLNKISYYGFSWGSYLGQVFATIYPSRVKRVIFDGVVDPGRVWYGANLDQDRAFDSNMDVFWKWIAAHDSVFAMGTDWKVIKADYYRMERQLATSPRAGGKLGPDELADFMLGAGYYVYGWQETAQSFADLVHGGDGADILAGYLDGNTGADAENGYAIYDGVQCTDNPWPGWTKTRQDSWRINATSPFLTWGNTWYNAPCLTWPAPARTRTFVRQTGALPKILLISETKDAATPYSGALEVRSRFTTSRLIAGVNGTTHAGSLSGVACVDDTIARYLATGKVPARLSGRRADLRCPKVPAQISSSARMGARPGMPAEVRDALIAAQRSSMLG